MIILGFVAATGLATLWALANCPLGRAIGLSVNRFADATHADTGLD